MVDFASRFEHEHEALFFRSVNGIMVRSGGGSKDLRQCGSLSSLGAIDRDVTRGVHHGAK